MPAPEHPSLWARLLEWLRRHQAELSLIWGIALAVVALLTIIWPTPRNIASVVGCTLLVVLDIRLELRKLRRQHERRVSITLSGRDDVVIAKAGVEVSEGELANVLNGAMRRAVEELEARNGGDDDG